MNKKDRTRNGLLGILNLSLIFGWGCGTAEGPQIQEGHSPTVATGKASSLGTRAFSPNGTIHPRGQPTTYFFEYGTGKEYGRRTEERPLPPRLAAYYRETWDEGLGGWWSWLGAKHVPSGGVAGGYVSYSEPSQHDHNHDDGIGTLHLIPVPCVRQTLDGGRLRSIPGALPGCRRSGPEGCPSNRIGSGT